MTKCHLGCGLLEYFLYKGASFGEEVAYSIWIYSSVKVLITAGANIVLYNEGAVITSCFRRLLSS